MAPESIIRSPKIIGMDAKVTGTVQVPDAKTLSDESLQKNLTITQVEWDDYCYTLGITLNDDQ